MPGVEEDLHIHSKECYMHLDAKKGNVETDALQMAAPPRGAAGVHTPQTEI